MEAKWIAIMAMVMFGAMFAGIGYTEHTKSQCQIEGIKADLTPEAIVKICGTTR